MPGKAKAWRNSTSLASCSWLTSYFLSSRIFQLLGHWWVSVMHVLVQSKLGKYLILFFLQGDVSLESELYICPSIFMTPWIQEISPFPRGWSVILFMSSLELNPTYSSPKFPMPHLELPVSFFYCYLHLTPSLVSISEVRNRSDLEVKSWYSPVRVKEW